MTTTTLEEAIAKLKREPGEPVRAHVDGLTVELRALPSLETDKLPGDLLAEIGWQGETASRA